MNALETGQVIIKTNLKSCYCIRLNSYNQLLKHKILKRISLLLVPNFQ